MNTKPDDEWLALWVEDELDEPRAREVEAWVAAHPEWREHREAARASKAMFARAMPAEDVPYAEFFNARIRREIEAAQVVSPVPASKAGFRGWLVPLTAAAGIALGFWAGRGGTPEPLPAPVAELAPVLYTPVKGVKAEVVEADDATVIVLAGVEAIPDEWEIPETAQREVETRPIALFR